MERIKDLLQLIKDNHELSIVPMVDSDVVASDDFSWWTAEWGRASIEEIWNDDERVYIRSKDEETLIDRLGDSLEFLHNLSDEEAEKQATKEVDNYKWEKVIAVRIHV